MFFFNPGANPLLNFLGGGTTNQMGALAPGSMQSPWRPGIQEMLSMQMQHSQYLRGLDAQNALINARVLFPGPGDVVRAQTPFTGDPEPAKVALEQFKPAVKDVTPDPEFECAQCGHPGPKDRLNGCQVCGGMVWK